MALPIHIQRQVDPVVALERAGRNGSIQERGKDRINRGDITLLGLASVGSRPLAGVVLASGNRHELAIRPYVGEARKTDVVGKSVSVRGDLGGRRTCKKKKNT